MPVLKRKTEDVSENEWYIHIPNKSGNQPPVYTIQVEDAGRDMFLDLNLNHDDAPNQAVDIDWDLFYTLDDLGLLYTLNTEYAPRDAAPSSESFKRLDDLSAEQRANFAHSLLDTYDAQTLFQHDHIASFFLSLDGLPTSDRSTLLGRLLESTPFDVETMVNSEQVFTEYAKFLSENDSEGYNSVLLSLIAHFVYDAWDSDYELYEKLQSMNEGAPIWVWDDWVAFAGSELMFYSINSTVEESLPDPLSERSIEEGGVQVSRFYDLLECEFSALWSAQTVTEMGRHNWALESLAQNGLQSGGASHCLIAPRPPKHDQSVPGDAIDEAQDVEGYSERSKKLARVLSKERD